MTAGTTSTSSRPTAVAAVASQEAPRGVILGASAVIAIMFAVFLGLSIHWEGNGMFAVSLVACGICALGAMVDDDRGARKWVGERFMR